MSISLCQICEYSSRPCAGKCACKIDHRDLQDHANANYCPILKYGSETKPENWDQFLEVSENYAQQIEEYIRTRKPICSTCEHRSSSLNESVFCLKAEKCCDVGVGIIQLGYGKCPERRW